MHASDLFQDIEKTYVELERYINDGSPTGFTRKTTTEKTSPFLGEERYPLLQFDDSDLDCILIGEENELLARGVNYAHPDSRCAEVLLCAARKPVNTSFLVSPTSGGRTMYLWENNPLGYLKLTYDQGRLGRVDRQLTLKHCQASFESSCALKAAIDDGKLPPSVALQLETSAKVSMLKTPDSIYEWGAIFREKQPYPYLDKIRQLIPGFSLFASKYDRRGEDDLLIVQLIKLSGIDPEEYLYDLLKMIFDCYWQIVLACAFHIEAHGQNVLFEVDESFRLVRMVIKDMDSVDRDIPLARYFGFRHDWESYPQGCFDERLYFYNIRASFMYDYKLGEYLVSPIIEAVAKEFNLDGRNIANTFKRYVQKKYIPHLPEWYFPADGCWYSCEDTERLPGQKREYPSHKNPKYR